MFTEFRDRAEGGRLLAEKLADLAGRSDVLVLALPRGGVPVGFEVARALESPLDVFVVRKLGVPGDEELAMGAIASGGVRVLNDEVIRALDIPDRIIRAVVTRELRELNRQERLYRGDRPPLEVRGRIVILVDDGIATGSTMRAAVGAVRRLRPARVIIAAPAIAPSTYSALCDEGHECVGLILPDPFHAVGAWYENFSQMTDEEVRELLERADVGVTAAARG
jgi:predicted phosphoribosyltransferase